MHKKPFESWAAILLTSLAVLCFLGCQALADSPRVLFFHAKWCKPCRAVASSVYALRKKGIIVTDIDIDVDEKTADSYGITRIPWFIAFGSNNSMLYNGGNFDDLCASIK